jgi:O-antigen ligase
MISFAPQRPHSDASRGPASASRDALESLIPWMMALVICSSGGMLRFFVLANTLGALILLASRLHVTLLSAPYALFILWACISITWAGVSEPATMYMQLLGGVAVGILWAQMADRARVLAMRNAAVCSIVIIGAGTVLRPRYSEDGALVSIFPHKNILGMALCVALIMLLATTQRSFDSLRKREWIAMAVAVWLLSASRSSTAIAVLAFSILVTILRRILASAPPNWRRVGVVVGSATAGVVAVGSGGWALAFGTSALDRSTDLTGRPEVWSSALRQWEHKPLMGYGLEHPWRGHGFRYVQGPPEAVTQAIWRDLPWTPASAHSSYVDLLLQLGAIGFALFLVVVAVCFVQNYRTRSISGASITTALVAILLYSVSESVLFLPCGIFVLTAASCLHYVDRKRGGQP